MEVFSSLGYVFDKQNARIKICERETIYTQKKRKQVSEPFIPQHFKKKWKERYPYT